MARLINEAEGDRREKQRERVKHALTEHFRRRDTNNGKTYCVECGASERRDGSIRHASDCAVSVALDAIVLRSGD